MAEKILLTISILCSGRPETRKCLESIKHLRETVPSELIITDTGCDEKNRAIIEEYADRIIDFEWVNDFSAARNVSLDAAKGHWYMYMDDDEWFINTDEMEKFFISGMYKDYNYACYNQRNYLNRSKELVNNTWVSRMVNLKRNNPRFVSTIHEYFKPLVNPGKLIHDSVEHFGYIFDTKEQERAHAKRNLPLLKKMIETEPDNSRWWAHILQEYRALDEYFELANQCRKGIEHFKDKSTTNINLDRASLYDGLLEALCKMLYWEEAKDEYEKAIADKRNSDYCNMRLNNLAEEIYYKLGDYDKVIECGKAYSDTYEVLIKDEIKRQNEESIFIVQAMEMSGICSGFGFWDLAELKKGNTKPFKEHFNKLNWHGPLMLVREYLPDSLDAFGKIEYDPELVTMISTMANRTQFEEFWNEVRNIEEKARNAADDKKEEAWQHFMNIARYFLDVNAEYYYVYYLRALYKDYMGINDGLQEDFEKMFSLIADVMNLDDSIFEIIERHSLNLCSLIEKISIDDWMLGIDTYFKKNAFADTKKRKQYIERNYTIGTSDKGDIRYEYFMLKSAEAAIVPQYSEDDFFSMQKRFCEFNIRAMAWCNKYYLDKAFEGEMPAVPAPLRVAYIWSDVIDGMKTNNRKATFEALKRAIGIFKPFDSAIQQFTHFYSISEKVKLDMEDKVAQAEEDERKRQMQEMADVVKTQIRGLVEQGMNKEAYDVYKQLITLVPDDPELDELEELITRGL